METKSTSPSGRYVVCVDPFEARNSQWVETPELLDTAAASPLLALTDRYWHLDSAQWQDECVVALELRHFPQPHAYSCTVVVDCGWLVATIDQTGEVPVARLGDALDEAYRRAAPA